MGTTKATTKVFQHNTDGSNHDTSYWRRERLLLVLTDCSHGLLPVSSKQQFQSSQTGISGSANYVKYAEFLQLLANGCTCLHSGCKCLTISAAGEPNRRGKGRRNVPSCGTGRWPKRRLGQIRRQLDTYCTSMYVLRVLRFKILVELAYVHKLKC